MIMLFSACSIIGVGILVWFKTPSGVAGEPVRSSPKIRTRPVAIKEGGPASVY